MNLKESFSPDQRAVVDYVCQKDGAFFLTGEAGTGKSYVVRALTQELSTAITATTGIAAQLIGGATLHSFLGITPRMMAPDTNKVRDRLFTRKLLVVDEISMADDRLVDVLFWTLDIIKWTGKVLFVGDLLQLPPVAKNDEVVDPCFKNEKWQQRVQMLYLSTQHRQSDRDFITALNHLRLGYWQTPELQHLVRSRSVEDLPEDCVQLTPYREHAKKLNRQRLEALPGELKEFDAVLTHRNPRTPPDDVRDIAESRARFPLKLSVKVGARVVMLNNDKDRRWVNGTTGVVEQIHDTVIVVRADHDQKLVHVDRAIEDISDGDEEALVKVDQYPMMLAWALTIHKAQGMTLDRVGVHLGRHFEAGQTYVALSRARTKEGLFLSGEMDRPYANFEAVAYLGEQIQKLQASAAREGVN